MSDQSKPRRSHARDTAGAVLALCACISLAALALAQTPAPAPNQPPATTIFGGKVVWLPNTVQEITAPDTGRIISPREQPYTVGDRVKKGAPVAIIQHVYNYHDASHISNARWDLLKEMLETRYEALEARIEREKTERLMTLGSASGQDVLEHKAAEMVTKAQYERRKDLLDQQDQQIAGGANLVRRPLNAAIDGEISFANFAQNQTVNEGFVLYRIVDRSQVGVTARVPESQYRPWPAGTAAKIRFDSLPGKEFRGALVVTPPVVDPGARTRDILFRVANPEELLRFGMIGQVEVLAK